MIKTSRACAALALFLGVQSAFGATLIPVVPPAGSHGFEVLAINDDNIIAGDYSDLNGVHGFFGTLDGTYTTFDYSIFLTEARGINNNGQIIAMAFPGGDRCTYIPLERSPAGKLTTIMKGSTAINGLVQGINTKGEFVGNYCDGAGGYPGYLGKNGKYRADVSIGADNSAVYPRGINSSKSIVGGYLDTDGTTLHGFLLHGGTTTTFDYPDKSAVNTSLQAVNDAGIAAGQWDAGDYYTHAFMVDTSTNTYKAIKIPGATASYTDGINNAGLMAVSSDVGQFIYCPGKKKDCPKGGFEVREPNR